MLIGRSCTHYETSIQVPVGSIHQFLFLWSLVSLSHFIPSFQMFSGSEGFFPLLDACHLTHSWGISVNLVSGHQPFH